MYTRHYDGLARPSSLPLRPYGELHRELDAMHVVLDPAAAVAIAILTDTEIRVGACLRPTGRVQAWREAVRPALRAVGLPRKAEVIVPVTQRVHHPIICHAVSVQP
jgi:hypothetical protein